jgi:hypothetical protein
MISERDLPAIVEQVDAVRRAERQATEAEAGRPILRMPS